MQTIAIISNLNQGMNGFYSSYKRDLITDYLIKLLKTLVYHFKYVISSEWDIKDTH